MSKDWKNNERMFAKQKSCRHCLTSRGIQKIKNAVSRAVNKVRKAWTQSRKNKNS
jgi:hypothetical protein